MPFDQLENFRKTILRKQARISQIERALNAPPPAPQYGRPVRPSLRGRLRLEEERQELLFAVAELERELARLQQMNSRSSFPISAESKPDSIADRTNLSDQPTPPYPQGSSYPETPFPVGHETYHNPQSRLRQGVADIKKWLIGQIDSELKVIKPRPLPLPDSFSSYLRQTFALGGQAAAWKARNRIKYNLPDEAEREISPDASDQECFRHRVIRWYKMAGDRLGGAAGDYKNTIGGNPLAWLDREIAVLTQEVQDKALASYLFDCCKLDPQLESQVSSESDVSDSSADTPKEGHPGVQASQYHEEIAERTKWRDQITPSTTGATLTSPAQMGRLDLGKTIAALYEDLRRLGKFSSGRRKIESVLRKQFPDLQLWTEIDASESLPSLERERFFAGRLDSYGQAEIMAFIGKIIARESASAYKIWKEYRDYSGQKRKRSPSKPRSTEPRS